MQNLRNARDIIFREADSFPEDLCKFCYGIMITSTSVAVILQETLDAVTIS